MATSVSHPIFARFYGRWAAGAEKAGAAEHRRKLLAGLTGKVIEVGAGNGLNFGYYPTTVTQLVPIEPEPRLRQQAVAAAARAAIPITVEDGTADRLPSGPEPNLSAHAPSMWPAGHRAKTRVSNRRVPRQEGGGRRASGWWPCGSTVRSQEMNQQLRDDTW
jgi:hypothetical protein